MSGEGASDPLALSIELLGEARSLGGGGESERMRRLAAALDRVDPTGIEGDAGRIAFWLNAYNGLLLHEASRHPRRGSLLRHRRMFRTVAYRVGGHDYPLDVIEHGVLRRNRRPPLSPRRLLGRRDPRLAALPSQLDPRIHFALNCGARSCPAIRTFSEGLDEALRIATRAYLGSEVEIDRGARTVTLPALIKLYRRDFGSHAEQLEFVAAHLGEANAGWLRGHGGEVEVRYSRFDWSLVEDPGGAVERP